MRKQAEDLMRTTLQRLDTLTSNLYTGVLMVSEDNKVEHVNQAFCDLYNLPDSPESLCGLTAQEMIKKSGIFTLLPRKRSNASMKLRLQESRLKIRK